MSSLVQSLLQSSSLLTGSSLYPFFTLNNMQRLHYIHNHFAYVLVHAALDIEKKPKCSALTLITSLMHPWAMHLTPICSSGLKWAASSSECASLVQGVTEKERLCAVLLHWAWKCWKKIRDTIYATNNEPEKHMVLVFGLFTHDYTLSFSTTITFYYRDISMINITF